MSTVTKHTTEIVFRGYTFNSKYDLEDAIEEQEQIARQCTMKMLALAVSTDPSKLFSCKDVNPVDMVIADFDNNLDEYKDAVCLLHDMKRLLNEWDGCHTKMTKDNRTFFVAIDKPQFVEPPYLEGDFVRTASSIDAEIENEKKEEEMKKNTNVDPETDYNWDNDNFQSQTYPLPPSEMDGAMEFLEDAEEDIHG